MQVTGSNYEQYNLSIRLSTDGFSFSIYNPIRDTLVLARGKEVETGLSLTANMRKALKEFECLSYTYKQATVLLVSKRFTLIPLELFAEDQVATAFYYNFSPRENETILSDTLPKNGAAVLYAVDKSLYQLLQEQYPSVQFRASVTFPAEHFAVKSRLGSDKQMYAIVHKEFMEIYAYQRGRMMLLNTYACKSDSDRMFYLLYVWKQLAMNQQTDQLCFVGNEEENSELMEKIRRFVRQVTTFKLPPEITPPY